MIEDLSTLKAHYRTGTDDLAATFFVPCLRQAHEYRRAAGYFSSAALVTWVDALPRLMQGNDLKIRLIASPELSPRDLEIFKDLTSEEKRAEYRQVVVERMLEEVIELANKPEDHGVRARVLAWLVANDRLDIRFAFAKHIQPAGIFHEKIGVFDFPGGEQVAFTGSANETLGGHRRNYESIDVYRSWVAGDDERVQTKVEQFEEAWEGQAVGLDVEEPTPTIVARLHAHAPKTMPTNEQHSDNPTQEEQDRWRHQDEAVEIFLARRKGVLEMATGTGKTRVALKILDRLVDMGSLQAAIVATDGTDLLDQWREELDDWALKSGKGWVIYRHFERHKQLSNFALDPHETVLLISRQQLPKVLNRVSLADKRNMLIVHDEVHGLGMPTNTDALQGQHGQFGWRLGLSATPERTYDQVGNKFILGEIGPTIFSFPLKAAIERGVLSEFDYRPLEYELTEGDRRRLRDVYAKQAARRHAGNPMSNEEVWTELAAVYKTAEMKPQVFSEHLKSNPEILKRCIIFVETKEYGNGLLDDLHTYTHHYRTYYAEDDRDHLVQFAQGEIDCLVTCHRISQGIDIRSLQTVVLFASARAKLETMQRIGRCLRVDPRMPEKRALVVDFVRTKSPDGGNSKELNADDERRTWLMELSKVRRIADG